MGRKGKTKRRRNIESNIETEENEKEPLETFKKKQLKEEMNKRIVIGPKNVMMEEGESEITSNFKEDRR